MSEMLFARMSCLWKTDLRVRPTMLVPEQPFQLKSILDTILHMAHCEIEVSVDPEKSARSTSRL